jgi:hypothetical protein
MVKKHMKKYSLSLAIKEMQIQTTSRFYLAPILMVILKSTNKQQVLLKIWGKWEPHTVCGNVS